MAASNLSWSRSVTGKSAEINQCSYGPVLICVLPDRVQLGSASLGSGSSESLAVMVKTDRVFVSR